MHPQTVFTKTSKGVLEVKNKTIKLPRDLGMVFVAVDGKSTFADLVSKSGIGARKLEEAIDKLVADGTATLTYWPLQFVNPSASPRLANAFAAAAANGKALGFADQLYGDFTKSWTTDQLIELGQQLGVGDAKYQQAVKDNTYAGWLDSVGKAADDRGVTGTPTVYLNGKQLPTDQLTAEGLQKAVDAIAS